MNTNEKIAKEKDRIQQDIEILDNLRANRLSEEPCMFSGEINREIERLEKDVMKHQKVLSRLKPAV